MNFFRRQDTNTKPSSLPDNWPHSTEEDVKAKPTREIQIGSEQNYSFRSNHVKTSKYEVSNFLPKFLMEEFNPMTKIANCYFLLVAVLQCIKSISNTNGVPTYLFPLSIVVTVDAITQVIDDMARHKADKLANSSITRRYSKLTHNFEEVIWCDLEVGDIVKIHSRELIPADAIILAVAERKTSAPTGICYVETKSLDGETNLKIRHAMPNTYLKITSQDDLEKKLHGGFIEMEHPNNVIESFTGILDLSNEYQQDREPIQSYNILLRGCVLRNTEYVYALIINTGHDTKIMMSNTETKAKTSKLESAASHQIIFIILLLVSVCFAGSMGEMVWNNDNHAGNLYYLQFNEPVGKEWIIHFFYLFLLHASFIPVSLYVTMSIVRLLQSVFMRNDLQMYYEKTDTPASVRTMTLNEQLGQISHIFTDKTGTLTCNVMDFRKMSIGGVPYGDGITEIGKAAWKLLDKPVPEHCINGEMCARLNAVPHVSFYSERFTNDYTHNIKQKMKIMRFFRVLALCHDVIPEKVDNDVKFSASNPDDEALVHAASYFGFRFIDRNDKDVIIECNEKPPCTIIKTATNTTTATANSSPNHGHSNNSNNGHSNGNGGQLASFSYDSHTSGIGLIHQSHSQDIVSHNNAHITTTTSTNTTTNSKQQQQQSHHNGEDFRYSQGLEMRHPSTIDRNFTMNDPTLATRNISPNTINALLRPQHVYQEKVQILDILEFTSKRKRMSVIVRETDGSIKLYIKGADTVIFDRCRVYDKIPEGTIFPSPKKRLGRKKVSHASNVTSTAGEGANNNTHNIYENKVNDASYNDDTISHLQESEYDDAHSGVGGGGVGGIHDLDGDSSEYPYSEDSSYYDEEDEEGDENEVNKGGPDIMNSTNGPPSPVRNDIGAWQDIQTLTEQHIYNFSIEGLRCLVLGYVDISEERYQEWGIKYHTAKANIEQIELKKNGLPNEIESLEDEIEGNISILGATGIEDKLQDGVPETIGTLAKAGINIWMLTGDKEETAINIAVACNLILPSPYMKQIIVNRTTAPTKDEIHAIFDKELQDLEDERDALLLSSKSIHTSFWEDPITYLSQLFNMTTSNTTTTNRFSSTFTMSSTSKSKRVPTALIIDGQSLLTIIDDETDEDHTLSEESINSPFSTTREYDKSGNLRTTKRRRSSVSALVLCSSPRKKLGKDTLLGDYQEALGLSSLSRKHNVIHPSHSSKRTSSGGRESLKTKLLRLSRQCEAVVTCRVSPDQKREMVKLIKDGVPGVQTLAIGDGANDVAMIQEAHVGVGIKGEEGVQAVNASDYAIAQFRFLNPLILKHGRYNYIRMSTVVCYMFYKNIAMTMAQFWFNAFNGFSGQKYFTELAIQTYNILYTSTPIIIYAIWDMDVPPIFPMKLYPQLYKRCINNGFFNTYIIWSWLITALYESAFASVLPMYYMINADALQGSSTFWVAGALSYTMIVIIVNIKFLFVQSRWNTLFYSILAGSVIAWFVAAFMFSRVFDYNWLRLWDHVVGYSHFWAALVLMTGMVIIKDSLLAVIKRLIFYHPEDILQEMHSLSKVNYYQVNMDDNTPSTSAPPHTAGAAVALNTTSADSHIVQPYSMAIDHRHSSSMTIYQASAPSTITAAAAAAGAHSNLNTTTQETHNRFISKRMSKRHSRTSRYSISRDRSMTSDYVSPLAAKETDKMVANHLFSSGFKTVNLVGIGMLDTSHTIPVASHTGKRSSNASSQPRSNPSHNNTLTPTNATTTNGGLNTDLKEITFDTITDAPKMNSHQHITQQHMEKVATRRLSQMYGLASPALDAASNVNSSRRNSLIFASRELSHPNNDSLLRNSINTYTNDALSLSREYMINKSPLTGGGGGGGVGERGSISSASRPGSTYIERIAERFRESQSPNPHRRHSITDD